MAAGAEPLAEQGDRQKDEEERSRDQQGGQNDDLDSPHFPTCHPPARRFGRGTTFPSIIPFGLDRAHGVMICSAWDGQKAPELLPIVTVPIMISFA